MILIKGNVERVAEDDALIERLEREGFQAMSGAPLNGRREAKKPLAQLKADELKALAKEKGIDGAGSLTKEELLAVLKDVDA